jgi:hypothetical protein
MIRALVNDISWVTKRNLLFISLITYPIAFHHSTGFCRYRIISTSSDLDLFLCLFPRLALVIFFRLVLMFRQQQLSTAGLSEIPTTVIVWVIAPSVTNTAPFSSSHTIASPGATVWKTAYKASNVDLSLTPARLICKYRPSPTAKPKALVSWVEMHFGTVSRCILMLMV